MVFRSINNYVSSKIFSIASTKKFQIGKCEQLHESCERVYPLTDPLVNALTIKRCKRIKRIITGTMDRMLPAAK